ncbi:hypothetical protein [Streptomyces lydicus]|uniref:hypothetical protein n=1 Tax=Streptomyces lydicus TaxID=47763 RepID=UPI00341F0216
MDLQGIGALAAAGVALMAIPITVLVGRWQLKAALRAAEATSEAGRAQADSAYRAALDAVRAEANATHVQWHRGVQREAYASFLLAAHRLREVGERFAADNEEELLPAERITAGKIAVDDALAALKAAQTIIELEGPDDVAAPAAVMTDATQLMLIYLRTQAIYGRALSRLSRITEDPSTVVSEPAQRLMQALSQMRHLHLTIPSDVELDQPLGQERETAAQSCSEALNALPPDTFEGEEFGALLAGYSPFPPALSQEYLDAVSRFDEAEERFVHAAKVELHSQVTS